MPEFTPNPTLMPLFRLAFRLTVRGATHLMSNRPLTATPLIDSPARRPPPRRRIFLPAGLIVTALALVGFWPTYYGRLFAGTVQASIIVHVHAVVMVTWLALFLTQIW